ncbi:MAG: hypothetical protein QOE36_1010, partial [Gaiellaceae bacterium]|nr:hypothetical protein [Gaiellaceae bacterium]
MTEVGGGRRIETVAFAHLAGVEPASAPAERRRVVPIAALTGLLVVVAALLVFFLRPGFGGSGGSGARGLDARVAAVIPLRPVLTHVAVGANAVWVSSVDSGTAGDVGSPGLLWRIDPRTNQRSGPLALGAGIDGLALVAGSIWVVDGESLRRINPVTGKVQATVRGVAAGQIVAGGGALWAGRQRIELPTLDVRPVDLPAGAVISAAGPAGVWAAGDGLYRLDPRNGRVVAHVARPGFRPVALAESKSSLWVAYSSR